MSYIYFTDEQKIRANSTDLVSFLQSQGEALERSGKEWRWKSHSGVVVFENKWYSHYENKGGLAIDFIQNFYNVSFPEAVSMLLNGETGVEMSQSELNKMNTDSKPSKQFKLPEANSDMKRVYAYLMKQRFIDRNVIDYFVQNKMIYEDKKYHNIVFVGYDENGVAKHAYKRGTYTHAESYKGNEAGSNPDYSFHHIGGGNDLYVFESAIDMLSFITLNQRQWKEKNYVALDGIAEHAMIHILSKNRNINRVILCLDNDIAGIETTGRLKGILKLNDYNNVSKIIPFNKDFNEDLKAFHGIEAIPAKEHPQVQLFKKVCNDIKLLHKDEYTKSCCDTSIEWFDKVAECYILARHNSTDEQIKNGKEKEVLELMKKAAVYLIINERKYLNGTNILPDCSNEDLRDRILRKLCKNYYPCSSDEKFGLSKLEKILSEIMRKDDPETVQTISNKLEILKLHNHAIGECIKSSIFIEQEYLQALAHENKDIESQIAIGI